MPIQPRTRRTAALLLAVLAWVAGGCGQDAPPQAETDAARPSLSPDAKLPTLAMLWDDLAAPRHPADGGGRAWLARVELPGETEVLRAGGLARFHIVYEAGPLGVQKDGAVYLQSSPFWDWSTPQAQAPDRPGYTTLSTEADGVTLEAETLAPQLMAVFIRGRDLAAGERIHLVFGAGNGWVRVDRLAERDERIWIAVDGDGDGVRKLVADPPTVDIAAGPPARLIALVPSTARPDEPFQLTLSVLDAEGNSGFPFEGWIEINSPASIELPATYLIRPGDQGRVRVAGVAREEGIFGISVRIGDLESSANPLVVSASAPRVLWADLHGHSQLTDGTGTVEDFFRYARDVSALDVVALTDHDHWGMQPLDQDPASWQLIRDTVERFHAPGSFLPLLGYEWTSWLYGHRHVVYFQDEGEIWSTLDVRTQTPAGLWNVLRGQDALTFAHHSAGGPIATDWSFRPDPEIEPVTEIASVHGSSEAMDAPSPIYNPVPGNFARDALDLGMRFGFIGSGDSHDGHPGLAHLASPSGGMAAIFSEDVTRESVLAALRARRTYATNGPRIWLRTALDGHPMGSILDEPAASETQTLDVAVAAPGALATLEVIRSGQISIGVDLAGEPVWSGEIAIPRLESGDYVYVRVIQEDGGAAWSSPIYLR